MPGNLRHPAFLFAVSCWLSALMPFRASDTRRFVSPRRRLAVSPWRGLDALPSICRLGFLPCPSAVQLLRAATRFIYNHFSSKIKFLQALFPALGVWLLAGWLVRDACWITIVVVKFPGAGKFV